MCLYAFTSPLCVRPGAGQLKTITNVNDGRLNVCSTTPSSQSMHPPHRQSNAVARMSAQDGNRGESNGDFTMNRRSFISTVLCGAAALGVGTFGGSEVAMAKSSLSGDYSQDAATLLADMRTVCDLARGTPGMADTVAKTRREMNDFVALYRRNEKVSGSTSFSTMYTAINTLSGHYASYGNAYPVPEKRKKRLSQQFTDIDRALNRGR